MLIGSTRSFAVNPAEAIGSTVIGAIEGKIEYGYLVTMVVGGEKLKGVLYHVPPGNKGPQFASLPGLLNSMNAELTAGGEMQTRRKRRRKEEMPKKDPNAPRPNRTGYNFFFAEQRQRLKALHPDKDREISRMIGEAWNGLSEEEKLVSPARCFLGITVRHHSMEANCSHARETANHHKFSSSLNAMIASHLC